MFSNSGSDLQSWNDCGNNTEERGSGGGRRTGGGWFVFTSGNISIILYITVELPMSAPRIEIDEICFLASKNVF